MDLLQTVRKEGSRGGRSEFKWEDVKDSHHRENYLGHSLMAPVGRWQQGRDLNWYAKAEGDQQSEADARKEELRRVKQAEEDAMAKALGLEPPQRPENNANMTQLGPRPGSEGTTLPSASDPTEGGVKRTQRDTRDDLKRERRRDREGHGHSHRRRSRSREHVSRRHQDRDEHRSSGDRDRHRHRRHRSRSRSRDRRRSRSREDPRTYERRGQERRYDRTSERVRSRSPFKRRSQRD